MSELTLADRATIANMSPEYGATMGFFPVDHVTLDYLRMTGRDEKKVMHFPWVRLRGLRSPDDARLSDILHHVVYLVVVFSLLRKSARCRVLHALKKKWFVDSVCHPLVSGIY